jgi:hypothetical protein
MARRKSARRKKTGRKIAKIAGIAKIAKVRKKQVAGKKAAAKRRTVARKKSVARKPAKIAAKKTAAKKKKSATRSTPRPRQEATSPVPILSRRGLGAASAGQSGDTQGLSRRDYLDSESVEELLEEGQYMEAEALSGVEGARDPDQGEVRTRQFPEDDVPEEYKDED